MDAYSLSKENSSLEIRRILQVLCDVECLIDNEEWNRGAESKELAHIRKHIELLTHYLVLKHERQFDLVKEWN